MSAKRVAVIGAGPAGLTAAYALAKRGVSVEVFEAGERVGGMAASVPLWGQTVDLGPHRFFSSDPRVNRLFLDILGHDYDMVSRLTRIYYRRSFFNYPLKPLNALLGLGPFESLRCIASYAKARISPPADTANFEGWVTSRFGRRLYEIFFKSYSEKLWGISCRDLDADFAAQRIRRFSLLEALRTAFAGNGGAKHKTLADEFAYPHGGAGMLYERMAEKLRGLGGEVRLGAPVSGVGLSGPRPCLTFADGSERPYDHVISTMPITRLVETLGAPGPVLAHARALSFRNTILVYLRVDAASPFPDQWIYVHSNRLETGRITNFRNWSPSITGRSSDTILCLEYWCNDDEPMWRQDEAALVELATREIHETGLVPRGSVAEGKVLRVPKCYPVYRRGYRGHVAAVADFLRQQQALTVIGRYGSFKYNNQDHSILMGLLAAENIAEGAAHDLWDLNSDYEYQETSRITATGLAAG